MDYEHLIRQAEEIPFEGWDFGVFRGRFVEAEPSWEFSKLLRTQMQRSSSMLDLGTGGGGVPLISGAAAAGDGRDRGVPAQRPYRPTSTCAARGQGLRHHGERRRPPPVHRWDLRPRG